MPHDSLFTFETLKTLGGASLLCFLIVAHTKGLVDKFLPWIPTNIYSTFIGTLILIAVQINVDPESYKYWQMYFLAIANGFLVSATASHTNELAKRFPKFSSKKKNGENENIINEVKEETREE